MLNQIDRVFQALGDPTRRALVERLGRGPASVSDLAAPFSLTLAAVVQHVQILEKTGIVRTTKRGRVRSCELRAAGLAPAERWLEQRRNTWEQRFDRLGALLEKGGSKR